MSTSMSKGMSNGMGGGTVEAAPVPTPSELPPHWAAYEDNGVAYYYNDKTGESVWEKPVL